MSFRPRSSRFSFLLLVSVLLCFTPAGLDAKGAPEQPTHFSGSGRLSNLGMKGSTKTLRAGALLQPFDPKKPDLFYQPVVLCEPVEVQFQDDGVSLPVHLEGFCYGPGLPIPPENVMWRVTGVFAVSLLNSHKCDLKTKRAIRKEQVKPAPPMSPKSTSVPCTRSESECRKDFDATVQRTYNKSLRQAEDDKTCTTEYGRQGYQRVLYLKCIPPAPRTAAHSKTAKSGGKQ